MSLLLLDVGNTSISHAVVARGAMGRAARVASHPASEAAWEEGIRAPWKDLDAAVLASVNPPAAARLTAWLREAHGTTPVRTAGKDFPVPVENRARHPREVGVDRLLNVLAAHARCRGPAIVVDFGTATTFDVVSPEGAYLGGAIAPGISVCFDALHAYTALLPRVAPEEPREAIGRDTGSCLQIGVLEGYRGLVRHLVARFRGELGAGTPVFLTGGEAIWAARAVPEASVVPDLTLEGLHLAYARAGAPGTRRYAE